MTSTIKSIHLGKLFPWIRFRTCIWSLSL